MQCTKSEDIVAICLVLAEGDIQKSIEEIIIRVENYQINNNRHFGISRYDFRGLFYELGVTLGVISYSDILNGKAKKN